MEDNKTNTTTVRNGLGLPMILFLIFLVLQLTGNIDWPWYAVAAPLLISAAIGGLFFVVAIIITIFAIAAG